MCELQDARDVLDRWIKRLKDGVPGEDYQAEGTDANDPEEPLNPPEWYEKFNGELLLVSAKCETLAAVVLSAAS